MTFVLVVLVVAAWACALQLPARRALLRWLLFGVFTFMGLALAVVGWISSSWDPAPGPHPTARLFMIGGLLMLAASVWTLLRAVLGARRNLK